MKLLLLPTWTERVEQLWNLSKRQKERKTFVNALKTNDIRPVLTCSLIGAEADKLVSEKNQLPTRLRACLVDGPTTYA